MPLRGKTVYDMEGDKIGKIEDFYLDNTTGAPEWIGIGAGLLKTKHLIVPIEGHSMLEDGIAVPYTKDQVKDSPSVDSDEISEECEFELYEHYGLRRQGLQQPTQTYGTTGRSQERQASAYETGTGDTDFAHRETESGTSNRTDRMESTGDSLVRKEEEMRVGTRPAEAGKVRLRKWVDTQPVSEDVTLRRETARVERQPLNEPVTDAEMGEREVEMSLRREEPVVEKRTVARERVGLAKGVEERTETVQENLAREHVEVEGDGDISGRRS
jgi:uncharacterized protein (TIGR02271 family)